MLQYVDIFWLLDDTEKNMKDSMFICLRILDVNANCLTLERRCANITASKI